MSNYDVMTKTPIPKLTLRLGFPAMVSMLVTTLYNMADTWFVSRLGVQAVGAVGVSFALMEFISSVGYLFGMGSGTRIGMFFGEGKAKEAGEYGSTAFFSVLALCSAAAALGLAFIRPLMRLLGSSETILPHAVAYARYILIGFPVMASSLVLSSILRCEGKMKYSMAGIGSGAVLNLVLDPLLIFACDMGVGGAALATLISQSVGLAVLLGFYCTGRTETKLALRAVQLKASVYVDILRSGLASLCRHMVTTLATVAVNTAAGLYGGDVLIACLSIIAKLTAVLMAVIKGFFQGSMSIYSYNMGARRYGRVREAYRFGVRFNTALMTVFALVCIVFAEPIMRMFSAGDASVVATGALALRLNLLALLFMPFAFSANTMLQCVGRPYLATLLALMPQGLFYIPALFILPRFFEQTGILLAPIAGWGMAAAVCAPVVVGFFRELGEKEKKESA